MKKIFKDIILLVVIGLTIYGIGKYGYHKYMTSLNFKLDEKLVVQFYNDENIYLIDLNNYEGNKLYLDLEKSKYNLNYIEVENYNWEKYINKKYYSNNDSIYIYNDIIYNNKKKINNLFEPTGVIYFTTNNKYLLNEIFPEVKCGGCEYYLTILSTETNRYKKLKIFDENGNELIIDRILGYVFK